MTLGKPHASQLKVIDCRHCESSGVVGSEVCHACGGTGELVTGTEIGDIELCGYPGCRWAAVLNAAPFEHEPKPRCATHGSANFILGIPDAEA